MKLVPIKRVVARLLDRLTRTYPAPPTSGSKATITVYSSISFYDWWNNLNQKQRNQLLKDAFKRP